MKRKGAAVSMSAKVLALKKRDEVPRRVVRRRSIPVPAEDIKNTELPKQESKENSNDFPEHVMIYTKSGALSKKVLFGPSPHDHTPLPSTLRAQGRHLGHFLRLEGEQETVEGLLEELLTS